MFIKNHVEKSIWGSILQYSKKNEFINIVEQRIYDFQKGVSQHHNE